MAIKFRAFDAQTGKMITEESSGLSRGEILRRYGCTMLCSGLTDNSGQEIYEGDLLKLPYSPQKAIVVFDNGAFRAEVKGVGTYLLEIILQDIRVVVVGNIHKKESVY